MKNYFRKMIDKENTNCMPSATRLSKIDYVFKTHIMKRKKTSCSSSERDFWQNVHLMSSVNAETVMEQKHSLYLSVLYSCH